MEWQLLSSVPAEHVRELLSIARRRRFERGEIVFHRDDPADSLHLVLAGHFAVRIGTPLGHSALIAIHGPGASFGELALVSDGATRSATVQSLADGETFAVFRDDFRRLQAAHPGVNRFLLGLMAEQLRRVNERVVAAHYLDAESRVRWALAELARTYAHGRENGEVVVPLTQEQVGELAGAARPTVNRVLKDEEKRGTIALERGAIRVVDLERLGRRVVGMPHPTRGSF